VTLPALLIAVRQKGPCPALPAGALVLLRLLGPFTAVAGQPITLCWRLERSTAGAAGPAAAAAAPVGAPGGEGAAPPQPEAVSLHYEVVAEVRWGGRCTAGGTAGQEPTR
jgi:hypothetical protein